MITKIKEATTRKDLRTFVRFPNQLYKDNPYYVPQIESMDLDTLTPEKNHAFEVCEGKYWLAYNEKGAGPLSSCGWNPRVFADDARGWQCPFVLCLHPQGCLRRGVRATPLGCVARITSSAEPWLTFRRASPGAA